MDFELRHVLALPPDAAFAVLMSPEFEAEADARLALDKTLVEKRATEDGWVKVWRIVEASDKPAFVRKLVGSAFEYTLEHRMQVSLRRVSWRVTPAVAADRVDAHGYEEVQPHADPDRAERIVYGKVVVSAPLVGGRLASFIGGEVQKGFENSLPFVERYVAEHGQG